MVVELKTAKIRIKDLKLDTPTKLTIARRFDAIFDENGIAEVPMYIAKKLLGPGYKGLYSLVEDAKPAEPKPVIPETQNVAPIKRSKEVLKPASKPEPVSSAQAEFVKEITD